MVMVHLVFMLFVVIMEFLWSCCFCSYGIFRVLVILVDMNFCLVNNVFFCGHVLSGNGIFGAYGSFSGNFFL